MWGETKKRVIERDRERENEITRCSSVQDK